MGIEDTPDWQELTEFKGRTFTKVAKGESLKKRNGWDTMDGEVLCFLDDNGRGYQMGHFQD